MSFALTKSTTLFTHANEQKAIHCAARMFQLDIKQVC